MPRGSMSAQIRALLQGVDRATVDQGCELLYAMKEPSLVNAVVDDTRFDDSGQIELSLKLKRVLRREHAQHAGLRLALLRVEMEQIPPPPVLNLPEAKLEAADARALALSAGIAGVRALDLRYNSIGDDGVRALVSSPHLGDLVELDVRYNGIGDVGAAALCGGLPALRILRLQRNCIGPVGVRALSGRGGLRELDLRHNPVGPHGATALAGSARMSSLEWLHLYGDDVGQVGMDALAASRYLPADVRRYWRGRAAQ